MEKENTNSKKNVNKDDIDYEELENILQEGSAYSTIQEHGAAIKEHLVSYYGVDEESGKTLKKGLKKISKSKINPENKESNIKQQAGFAAEEKYVAKENAKRVLKGKKSKVVRSDDVGKVNDVLFDHFEIDASGNIIEGSGEQMKFIGRNGKECYRLLKNKKFEKYFEVDAKITIPSDYYSEAIAEAEKEISKLEKQLEVVKKENPSTSTVDAIQKKLDKARKIRSSLKDSGITSKEAVYARTHPKMSTAKDIGKLAHESGLEQAKTGAVISGSISIIKNLVCVIKGEKDPKKAAVDIVKDVGEGTISGYATAFSGSVIKGTMQNSSSAFMRSLSKTNIASTAVVTIKDIGENCRLLIKGEISGLEFLENLGKNGTNQLSGAMFAAIGQASIPIPVVGAIVGSLIGYFLSNQTYSLLVDSLKQEKRAKEERIAIEAMCKESIALRTKYIEELQNTMHTNLIANEQFIKDVFVLIGSDSIDDFYNGINMIIKGFGGEIQFKDFNEFDEKMRKGKNTCFII